MTDLLSEQQSPENSSMPNLEAIITKIDPKLVDTTMATMDLFDKSTAAHKDSLQEGLDCLYDMVIKGNHSGQIDDGRFYEAILSLVQIKEDRHNTAALVIRGIDPDNKDHMSRIYNGYVSTDKQGLHIRDSRLVEVARDYAIKDGAMVFGKNDGLLRSEAILVNSGLPENKRKLLNNGDCGCRHNIAYNITCLLPVKAITQSEADGTFTIFEDGRIVHKSRAGELLAGTGTPDETDQYMMYGLLEPIRHQHIRSIDKRFDDTMGYLKEMHGLDHSTYEKLRASFHDFRLKKAVEPAGIAVIGIDYGNAAQMSKIANLNPRDKDASRMVNIMDPDAGFTDYFTKQVMKGDGATIINPNGSAQFNKHLVNVSIGDIPGELSLHPEYGYDDRRRFELEHCGARITTLHGASYGFGSISYREELATKSVVLGMTENGEIGLFYMGNLVSTNNPKRMSLAENNVRKLAKIGYLN